MNDSLRYLENIIQMDLDCLHNIPNTFSPSPAELFVTITFQASSRVEPYKEYRLTNLIHAVESAAHLVGLLGYRDVAAFAMDSLNAGLIHEAGFHNVCISMAKVVHDFRQSEVKPKPLGAVFRRDTDIK